MTFLARRRRVLVAAVLPALLAVPAARAASVRDCARMVIADPIADAGSGPTGAACDIDLTQPADQDTSVLGGTGAVFLSHVAAASGRVVYLSDLEADPSGLGPDPNGQPGRGAVFLLDQATGGLVLIADGTACGAGVTNCGAGGVFVDPLSLAWSDALGLLVVVDIDADPTGLGTDRTGHAGHGGVFAVDVTSGTLTLIADGSNYPAGLPPGASTIFEDPIAAAFARDGTLYVLDQLAQTSPTASVGGVFRVDVATGAVTLVSRPQTQGPRDLAVEPGGTLLLLDMRFGTSAGGAILRIDPALPPDTNVVASLLAQELVEPTGLVVEGNGTIHVSDAAADPFANGSSGAVFAIDPGFAGIVAESSTPDYASPWSVALLEPESLDALNPVNAAAGTSATVRLIGGIFDPTPVVDFGPGITVNLVTWVSPTDLDVDITVAAGATVGVRDVRVTNPNHRMAFHCELFEVLPPRICAPTEAVGDTLLVTKTLGGAVRLDWAPVVSDACVTGYRVRRAGEARPAVGAGTWPDDPAFANVDGDDLDGSSSDATFTENPLAGTNEYFLVTTVNAAGDEGPSGHYGG